MRCDFVMSVARCGVCDPPLSMPFDSFLLQFHHFHYAFYYYYCYFFSIAMNRYKLRNEMRKEGNYLAHRRNEKLEKITTRYSITSSYKLHDQRYFQLHYYYIFVSVKVIFFLSVQCVQWQFKSFEV